MKKIVIYLAAFIVPPILITTLRGVSSVSDVMIHKAPKPLTMPVVTSTTGLKTASDSTQLRAIIVLGSSGTELTDFMAPYEILAESGGFEVSTAAASRDLLQTTGAVNVLADSTFSDAPVPDLLVIPAVLDPTEPALLAWIKLNAPKARLVLSLCEGARVAQNAGLTENKKMTSHFIALEDLRANASTPKSGQIRGQNNGQASSTTTWIEGMRYVEDHNLISSAGITASLDATLYAVEKLKGAETAQLTAQRLGYAWKQEMHPSEPISTAPLYTLHATDFLGLFLGAGLDLNHHPIGIVLYPGVSELALAANLDTLPRTLSSRVFTISPERKIVKTQHGLQLIASQSFADPDLPDFWIVPSGKGSAIPKEIRDSGIPIRDFSSQEAGRAFDQALEIVSTTQGSSIARTVAKLMEYPIAPSNGELDSRTWILIRNAILLGLAGVFVAWLLLKRNEIRVKVE